MEETRERESYYDVADFPSHICREICSAGTLQWRKHEGERRKVVSYWVPKDTSMDT